MKEIRCNFFVKKDMWTSYDVVWRPIADFSIMEHTPSQKNRECKADLRSHRKRRPVGHLFMVRVGKRSPQLLVPASSRDEEKIRKCCSSNSLVPRLFLSDCGDSSVIRRKSYLGETFPVSDQFVEEPWLLQPSLISECVADLDVSSDIDNYEDKVHHLNNEVQDSKFYSEYSHAVGFRDKSDYNVNGMKIESKEIDAFMTNYPVEEPWLFEPLISTNDCNVNMTSDVSKDEVVQSEVNEQLHSITENLLLEEESNSVMREETVSTVILINSSICTMQRIAVLENGKLVELLLEPVKNNVQSDSVYLGVVTKLVPHMGGAFVNIGSPRPSLMEINDNRKPFILSPVQGHMKEREVNDSPYNKPVEEKFFPQNGTLFHGIEEPDTEDDDLSEDECIDDEFGDHENHSHFDVLKVIKENVNGSITEHALETGGGTFSEVLHGDQLDVRESSSIIAKEGSKWEQVQKGSKIIVQVVKEGLGTKGPTLTAYPKLKSRFWILMTRCRTIGISKKITGVERTRLRVIAKTLQPPGFGLTVRTVASGHSLEELQKDLESLLSTWKSIVEQAKSAALAAEEGVDGAVPVMLHRAMGQTLSVVQDYFNDKVKSLVVDSPRTYHEVTNYLQEIAPNLCERIELYSKKIPLFDEYNIEGEINNILSKWVSLDNGGYLVIEQTEALVSIDVNGGQCMLGQGTSQEKAILEVNLAAAKQIARELRLRDIGGIIVVDFIDMLDDSNKRLVYEEVKKAVERDRSTVRVSELSRQGLMEITRKRVRPSVTFMISEPCTCCHGTGRVEALDTSFSKIEHEICRLLATVVDHKADPQNPKSWPRFVLRVGQHMCNYLTSGKRTKLAFLSSSLKVWLLLKVERGLTRGAFEVKPLTEDNLQKDQQQAAISVLQPTEVVRRTPNKKVTLFPIKKWITGRK